MQVRVLTLGLCATLSLVACGGKDAPKADSSGEAKTLVAEAAEPAQEVAEGSIVFEIDGQAKSFDYLPASDNMYTSISSKIEAKPSADAAAELSIIFLSIDLKKETLPADLPRPLDLSGPGVRSTGTVGFGYINESGHEWTAVGKVHVESFGNDGTVEGTFTDISLGHKDKELPNIVLTNGSFRVTISSPW